MNKNIFLDFLNRASATLYGLSKHDEQTHVRSLTDGMNVAAFLCREFCVLPPGFLAECSRAQRAMMRKIEYARQGVIRFSMRENSIDDYFQKKEEEYKEHRDEYQGLFDPKVQAFVKRQGKGVTTLSRELVIGDKLVDLWQEGPDTRCGYFREKLNKLQIVPGSIEKIRAFPAVIRGENKAVTWPAISKQMKDLSLPVEAAELQHVVQHLYFRQYIEAHDLAVVTGLPFVKHGHFGLSQGDFSHDFEVLRHALRIIGCLDIVLALAPRSMIALRAEPGFYAFRDAVVETGTRSSSRGEACRLLSGMTCRLKQQSGRYSLFGELEKRKRTGGDLHLEHREIQSIAEYFLMASVGAGVESDIYSTGVAIVNGGWSCPQVEETAMQPQSATDKREEIPLAIFCALDEERRRLIKAWGLTAHHETNYWSGIVENTHCLLYSTNDMGRVAAAIATMKFLREFSPKCILALGIAGGFKPENVAEGDLIVPSHIADLAIRKIREKEGEVTPEMRPRPFETSKKVVEYLHGAKFNREEWVAKATEYADWPHGRRPNLHFAAATMVSSDEVVSSTEWVATLFRAWPQVKGVEMEAGGVCAAAKVFDIPVTVIRGISDLADPLKQDNDWRRRAMETVITFVEVLLRAKVIP